MGKSASPSVKSKPTRRRSLKRAIERFLEIIDANDTFLVVSHVQPDGDAVGSALAMSLLLEQYGKEVTCYNRDPIPYNLQFLPGSERWTTKLEDDSFDVTILLDCGEPARIGEDFPEHGWGREIVVIDHHKTYDANFASHYVRDVAAAATGEIIYRILRARGELRSDVAINLYCCLMTDTGSFRYSNTSQDTFTIAGELIASGVDAWYMTSNIYESEPHERLDLLCRVLQTLEMSPCGRLAFLCIDQQMLAESGADVSMTDGFINYARSVRGVEVATQIKEEAVDRWKISFRSRGAVDVSELAARFGGGGHHNAAGCSLEGSPSQIKKQLTRALVEMLDG